MYRSSTPIFDVPEFPSMRRVKPLPKRRRTMAMEPLPQDVVGGPLLPAPALLGADELIAHADTLSAQMALQSYYMPILGGVQDLLKTDFGAETAAALESLAGEGEEHGEGDYVDHLQQPGNTKKRKVPANAHSGARGVDAGSVQSGEEEESLERGGPGGGRVESDAVGDERPGTPVGVLGQRKARLSKATKIGLQHKELLKHRKRQLSAVLGALSQGDTLALDQALSANYPFANRTGQGGVAKNAAPPKVRPSRRKVSRVARALRVLHQNVPASMQRYGLVTRETEFTFNCQSATSERLIATKEEVAALHARFEVELARQAAKAAEAAKAAASSLSKAKRTERTKQRARTTKANSDPNNSSVDSSLAGAKTRTKKKKRSALANASNPHHLRNYVPSRLPHSGQNPAQTNVNAQNFLSPPPLRFLSAEIPARRRKKSEVTPVAQLTNPADEWICPFCEYDLFYSDEQRYRRAVRNRKTILKRRRRARERAAAAASGKGSARAPEKKDVVDDDVNPGFAPPHADVPAQNQWVGDAGGGEGDGGGHSHNAALG